MKIRIKGMKIVGINTIRKAIDKSKLVLLDTTINRENKTFTGKRWVNPSSALDLFKEEIGVKDGTNLIFTLKSNKKVSLNEKELTEAYLEKNKGQSLQTFIKDFFTIGKENGNKNKENSITTKTKETIKEEKQSITDKIIKDVKSVLASKDEIKSADDLLNLARKTSSILKTDLRYVRFLSGEDMYSRGACSMDAHSFVQQWLDYSKLFLQANDERSIEYKIKTVFHECFHLKANQYFCDRFNPRGPDFDKWTEIEETMTECAAQYLYSEYDKEAKLSPPYCKFLIKNLPKLKQIDGYKDCKTIYDFGRRALENRVNTNKVEWLDLYEKLENISLDKDYYKPYEDYVEKNKDKLAERIIANSPTLADDKEDLGYLLDDYLLFREAGSNVGGNYRQIYEEFIANAMLDMGVL